MKKQITFYGKYAIEKATEYLNDLQKCFDIRKASINYYEIKSKPSWVDDRKRCKVVVNFK